MKGKGLVVLAGVTAAALGVAAWVVSSRSHFAPETASVSAEGAGPLLLPGLEAKANSVTVIELNGNGQSTRLEKRGEVWVVASKDGYPAAFEKVRMLVIELGRARVLEEKTAKPELFAMLGVAEPGAGNADATQVTLSGADGARIAGVVVGKDAGARGPGGPRRYVRAVQESGAGERAVLVGADLSMAKADAMEWVAREIGAFAAETFVRATFTAPDGERVEVDREPPAEGESAGGLGRARLVGVPEGREAMDAFVGQRLMNGLGQLTFEDVKVADAVDMKDAATAVFEGGPGPGVGTGLVVTVRLALEGEKHWATFEAAQAGADGRDAREAARLNEKWRGWAFALPGFKGDLLRPRMERLLKPLEQPGAAEDGPEVVEPLGGETK